VEPIVSAVLTVAALLAGLQAEHAGPLIILVPPALLLPAVLGLLMGQVSALAHVHLQLIVTEVTPVLMVTVFQTVI
jgi:hypothetical protein